MPSQQLVHVVNVGLGPDGQQRCRRCGEAMPYVSAAMRGAYPEGSVVVLYNESGAAIGLVTLPVGETSNTAPPKSTAWPNRSRPLSASAASGVFPATPECIALDGTPLRIPAHA